MARTSPNEWLQKIDRVVTVFGWIGTVYEKNLELLKQASCGDSTNDGQADDDDVDQNDRKPADQQPSTTAPTNSPPTSPESEGTHNEAPQRPNASPSSSPPASGTTARGTSRRKRRPQATVTVDQFCSLSENVRVLSDAVQVLLTKEKAREDAAEVVSAQVEPSAPERTPTKKRAPQSSNATVVQLNDRRGDRKHRDERSEPSCEILVVDPQDTSTSDSRPSSDPSSQEALRPTSTGPP